jgi:exonuclease VII small subunit
MLNKSRILGVVTLLFTLSAITFADQPFMRAARTDLQQARARLQNAIGNKGGHRVKAIEHVNKAIAHINTGMSYDRRHNHVLAAFNTTAAPDQPNMQAALEHLRQAKDNLERASSDKGGYRKKAIDEVEDAISETKKGIDAGE